MASGKWDEFKKWFDIQERRTQVLIGFVVIAVVVGILTKCGG